jgi:hypothetical protein
MTLEEAMVEKLKVIEHAGNSDHNIVSWRLISKVQVGKSKKTLKTISQSDKTGALYEKI